MGGWEDEDEEDENEEDEEDEEEDEEEVGSRKCFVEETTLNLAPKYSHGM